MYGDVLSFADTMNITIVGMGTVFSVLILLVFVLMAFRFIPAEKKPVAPKAVQQSAPPAVQPTVQAQVSPEHKAVIIAAVLESLNAEDSKYNVRIKNIKLLS